MQLQEALGKIVETVITLERAGSRITSLTVVSEETCACRGECGRGGCETEYDFTPAIFIETPIEPGNAAGLPAMAVLYEESLPAGDHTLLRTEYSAQCNGCEIRAEVIEPSE
uniref:Uncharacterized protein n=1 Tax=Candidatus Kentrum sp. UNK TaxID=2126344 RepID=A0A451B687_9GAMM|nr:MAG: hypothetical protein BECKUNK1418G_GA0071005_13072 [Candidatus Kentron sp. UNK]VFK73799.1 MAG: hypothetical protein BECKUNK1418H_GA0071006_12962 [Candidatus Kentron sp. UNK]